ncbi:MAG: mobilization protein [Pseudomonadota bacterium]
MPRTKKPIDQQLAELADKEAQIKAKRADLRARQQAEDRKRDTRRKIVVGAVVMEHAEHDPQFMELLAHVLDRHVIRDTDRELLGLPKRDSSGDAAAEFQTASS